MTSVPLCFGSTHEEQSRHFQQILSLSLVAALKDIIDPVDVLEKASSVSGCTGKSVHYPALYLACVPAVPVAPRASVHPAGMA